MRRLNEKNINSPKVFDDKFPESFGLADVERLEKLAKYFKEGKYLDVGCFDSIMPVILAERYPQAIIYAMDFAPRLIDYLKLRFPKVNYFVGNVGKIPFENEELDYVVAGEVIEHVDSPEIFMNECLRVLKTGGCLALSTPLNESDKLEIGGDTHVWSFTEEDFKEWGFDTEIWQLSGSPYKTIIAWKIKK